MRIQIESKVSLILILMAGASLVSMLCTLNIDHIINHDLYSYGLQFSTKWAYPYWTMATIVFSMGWLIIVTSIAFELHLVIHELRKHPSPEAEAPVVHEKLVQNETSGVEAQPSSRTEEEKVKTTNMDKAKTTALVLKTEDDLSEFRVLLEQISVMTDAQVKHQKTDDN